MTTIDRGTIEASPPSLIDLCPTQTNSNLRSSYEMGILRYLHHLGYRPQKLRYDFLVDLVSRYQLDTRGLDRLCFIATDDILYHCFTTDYIGSRLGHTVAFKIVVEPDRDHLEQQRRQCKRLARAVQALGVDNFVLLIIEDGETDPKRDWQNLRSLREGDDFFRDLIMTYPLED
ncbi:MAG: hypothetical protein RMK91_02880 [Pseudanabaenaceae cyanobacterium SKYGB_i_bin29]|nr:hypothetical protein [Pseudanabaenaceae cyanobacterium SKYG29]MDW8420789.1 hypothetical protein [Pseudanabaenaceae cyanobacterium SKYGB_i_bin29]